jgi:hypothetical protein
MKTTYGTPVVIDSDGDIRWVGAGIANSLSSTFLDKGFIVGTPGSTEFSRLEFDGIFQICAAKAMTRVLLFARVLIGFT